MYRILYKFQLIFKDKTAVNATIIKVEIKGKLICKINSSAEHATLLEDA